MNVLALPWLDLSICFAFVGALFISRLTSPSSSFRFGLFFTFSAFFCAAMAWLAFYMATPTELVVRWSLQPRIFGRQLFLLDELNAPLIPAIALMHFLTAVATPRTHMRNFSVSWSLAADTFRLMTFSCKEPWYLIGLLAILTIPPYVELRNRKRPTKLYVRHMAVFIVLLIVGWAGVELGTSPTTPAPWWATIPLLLAILIICGTVPAHCWLTDWFEHSSYGIALLTVVPLTGVYAAVRLVFPIAPGWVLQSIGLLSLITAIYTAGMATVQRDLRRFFANLFLSLSSLVLVGLELHTELSLCASLCLWFSAILTLGGFGLTLRALEGRFGRLVLIRHYGLYEHSPTLAVCFMLTGLACIGFPFTLGFISSELLVDSAVEASPLVGVGVVAASALNGIAVLRAYFLLFTGSQHHSSVSLELSVWERGAILTLTALIIGGGLYPQPGISTRMKAAEAILADRLAHSPEEKVEPSDVEQGEYVE